jgi:hypothetical protein
MVPFILDSSSSSSFLAWLEVPASMATIQLLSVSGAMITAVINRTMFTFIFMIICFCFSIYCLGILGRCILENLISVFILRFADDFCDFVLIKSFCVGTVGSKPFDGT